MAALGEIFAARSRSRSRGAAGGRDALARHGDEMDAVTR
jgi:hypothetical protein